MRSGALRDRITIQRKVTTRSGIGAEIVSWEDVATVWASFEPLRGFEYFTSRQTRAETAVRFVIRYRAGVEPDMRVTFGGKVYEIEAVIDTKGQRKQLEVMTREGSTNG